MQTDALAASACILSIAVYHAVHLFRVLRKPNSTVFGRASASRVRWVKFIASQKKDVLAVQTLRNLIMVSSIMASTCVVLIFGFISFFSSLPSSTPQNFVLENHTLSTLFGIRVDGTFASKVLAILLLLTAAFFCFAQAMRFYTHVTIAINVSQFVRLSSSPLRHPARNHLETTLLESSTSTLLEDEITAGTSDLLFDWATRTPNDAMPHTAESVHSPADTDVDTPEFIASLFNRGAAFHHAGMRACYCVFPVLGYLWGWRILVLSTPMLLITLKAVDDVDSFFGFMRWVTGRRRVDRGSLSDCTIRLV